MKTNIKIAVGAVGFSLLAAAISFGIQPPASWNDSTLSFHLPLAASVMMVVLHLAAAVLFLQSLGVYKAKLQRAFMGIVLGIVLVALGTIQLPILDASNGWNSAYVTHGFVILPFLVSGLVLYIGAATFGRLIGVVSIFTNKLAVVVGVAVLAALSAALPHVHTTVAESSYDLSNAINVWALGLFLASALVFLWARRSIGAHYKFAILWLGLALLTSTSCLAIALFDTLVSTQARDSITQVLNVMTVIAGFAWLKAGYTFTKTKEY